MAETLGEKDADDRLWLEANEALAELCLTLGRYDEADRLYTLLLNRAEKAGLPPAKIARYHRFRGKVFEIQGDYEHALPCYKQARELLPEVDSKDQAGQLERIWAINALGGLYVRMGKYDKAMKISIEALRIIESLNETIEHAVVFTTIGKANYYRGNLPQAIEFHRRSLEIEEKLGDVPEMILTLNNLGESYQADAEYREAYECFKRAVELSEEIGDSYGRALSLHGLGSFYVAVGEIEKAEEAQQASLRLSRSYRMRQLSHSNYILQGMILKEKGDLTKAEGSLFRALTAFAKQGNRWELCHLLLRVAQVHRCTRNFEEAERMVNDAMRLSQDLMIARLRFHCFLEQGRLFYAKGRFRNAVAFFGEAVAQLADYTNSEAAAEVFSEMAEALVKCRRVEEARELFERAAEKAKEVLGRIPEEFRETYRNKHPAWYREIDLPEAEAEEDSRGGAIDETRRFELVTSLTGELASGVDPTKILGRALSALREHVDAEFGFLLRCEGDEEVRVVASSDRSGERVRQPSSHIVAEIIGEVLMSGEPILAANTASHPRTKKYDEVLEKELRSVAVIPLKSGESTLGILYLANPSVHLAAKDLAAFTTSFIPILTLALAQYQNQEG